MYRNDERRIIMKDINFLVYVQDSKDIPAVLEEIEQSGEYEGEEIIISLYTTPKDFAAFKKDGAWETKETKKPFGYR